MSYRIEPVERQENPALFSGFPRWVPMSMCYPERKFPSLALLFALDSTSRQRTPTRDTFIATRCWQSTTLPPTCSCGTRQTIDHWHGSPVFRCPCHLRVRTTVHALLSSMQQGLDTEFVLHLQAPRQHRGPWPSSEGKNPKRTLASYSSIPNALLLRRIVGNPIQDGHHQRWW